MAGLSMTPGGGGRFAALAAKLSTRAGVRDPKALAAAIGRKKYGAKKMSGFAANGRAKDLKAHVLGLKAKGHFRDKD